MTAATQTWLVQAKVKRRPRGQLNAGRLLHQSQLQHSQATLLPAPRPSVLQAAATEEAMVGDCNGGACEADAVPPAPVGAAHAPPEAPAQEVVVVPELGLLARSAADDDARQQQPCLATEDPEAEQQPAALPGSWAQLVAADACSPQHQSLAERHPGHTPGQSACATASVTASLEEEGTPQVAETTSAASALPAEEQHADPCAFTDELDMHGVQITWQGSSEGAAGCAAGSKVCGGLPGVEQHVQEEPVLESASPGLGAHAEHLRDDNVEGQVLPAQEQLNAQTQPGTAERRGVEDEEPPGQLPCPPQEQRQQERNTDGWLLAFDKMLDIQQQPGMDQEQGQEETDPYAFVDPADEQLDAQQQAGTQSGPEQPGGDQPMEVSGQLGTNLEQRGQQEDDCAQAAAQPLCTSSPPQPLPARIEQDRTVEAPRAQPVRFGCKRCRHTAAGCSWCNPAKRKGGCAKCYWKLAGCATCKNAFVKSKVQSAAAGRTQAPLAGAQQAPHDAAAKEEPIRPHTAAAAPAAQVHTAAVPGSHAQRPASSMQPEASGCPSGLQQADVGHMLATLVDDLAGHSGLTPGQPQREAGATRHAEVASTPQFDSEAQLVREPATLAGRAGAAQDVQGSPAWTAAPAGRHGKRGRADTQSCPDRQVRSCSRVRRPPSAYWQPKPEPDRALQPPEHDDGGGGAEREQRRRSSRHRPQHDQPWWARTSTGTPC